VALNDAVLDMKESNKIKDSKMTAQTVKQFKIYLEPKEIKPANETKLMNFFD
jgi:hypothetical protein